MCFKETKDLLNKLNSENIEELKSILTRKVNELILNVNDDNKNRECKSDINRTFEEVL